MHVLITDLTGGCYKGTLNAANAHQVLAGFEQRFAQVFAQANITIDSWIYTDSKAPSTINVLANNTRPSWPTCCAPPPPATTSTPSSWC